MWWRILTFCLLVTLILFIVLSCIHGRPVIHLFFRRCCEEGIENDQVIFDNFGNGFLKERLIGFIDGNDTALEDDELVALFKDRINVHDPGTRIHLEFNEIYVNGTEVTDNNDEVTDGNDIVIDDNHKMTDGNDLSDVKTLSDEVNRNISDTEEVTNKYMITLTSDDSDEITDMGVIK